MRNIHNLFSRFTTPVESPSGSSCSSEDLLPSLFDSPPLSINRLAIRDGLS